MILSVGLQDATMAEGSDFGSCLTRFGLDWAEAKAKVDSSNILHGKRKTCNASGCLQIQR